MNLPDFNKLQIGDSLPPLQFPPLSRLVLALYCGASGDHNPVHVDIDYARNIAGREDVIGHGSLTMAYMARMLTNWADQRAVRFFRVRLHAPTCIGDSIRCSGRIADKIDGEERRVRIVLSAKTETGKCLATGEATLVWQDYDSGSG